MKIYYFESIIDMSGFSIYYEYQLKDLLHEKNEMEKIVGFEMPFTNDFYNYQKDCFNRISGHEGSLKHVSKEMREEIIYFTNLKKEKELRKKQEKEQEVINNEKVKNEYNKFLTIQRKSLLWKLFPDHKYNEVIKDFELEEQNNITIIIPKN